MKLLIREAYNLPQKNSAKGDSRCLLGHTFLKSSNFRLCQFARLARHKIPQDQRALAYPPQAQNGQAQITAHPSDLPIQALAQHHLQQGCLPPGSPFFPPPPGADLLLQQDACPDASAQAPRH